MSTLDLDAPWISPDKLPNIRRDFDSSRDPLIRQQMQDMQRQESQGKGSLAAHQTKQPVAAYPTQSLIGKGREYSPKYSYIDWPFLLDCSLYVLEGERQTKNGASRRSTTETEGSPKGAEHDRQQHKSRTLYAAAKIRAASLHDARRRYRRQNLGKYLKRRNLHQRYRRARLHRQTNGRNRRFAKPARRNPSRCAISKRCKNFSPAQNPKWSRRPA